MKHRSVSFSLFLRAAFGALLLAGLPRLASGGEPGLFQIDFSRPGYETGRSVVMQGQSLTRWIGHSCGSFQLEKDPEGGSGNRLALRWSETASRMAFFQPSDIDFGVPYRRDLAHQTTFRLQWDRSNLTFLAAKTGEVNCFYFYVGGKALRLALQGHFISAIVFWPGGRTTYLGQVPVAPNIALEIAITCQERSNYEVEITEFPRGKSWRAFSRRKGSEIETQMFLDLGFSPAKEKIYDEKRVPAHWMNPEWDCIPEIIIEADNPHPFPLPGTLFLDRISFRVNLPNR